MGSTFETYSNWKKPTKESQRYFTRAQLIAAAKHADRTERNRRIAWENLPPDVAYYPVVFEMIHNDCELRLEIMLDGDGNTAFLDVPFETYDELGFIQQLLIETGG